MRKIIAAATLALALSCGLFAVAKAVPAEAMAAYRQQLSLQPRAGIGCGCLGCNCLSCG